MSERLAELIREQQPCVALTGAGVSTETHGAESREIAAGDGFQTGADRERRRKAMMMPPSVARPARTPPVTQGQRA
jgi:NAD-dependent SIR2 family protein deacetylase